MVLAGQPCGGGGRPEAYCLKCSGRWRRRRRRRRLLMGRCWAAGPALLQAHWLADCALLALSKEDASANPCPGAAPLPARLQCPNGKECKYRHALPPGYVMKSQMKELLELEAANVSDLPSDTSFFWSVGWVVVLCVCVGLGESPAAAAAFHQPSLNDLALPMRASLACPPCRSRALKR